MYDHFVKSFCYRVNGALAVQRFMRHRFSFPSFLWVVSSGKRNHSHKNRKAAFQLLWLWDKPIFFSVNNMLQLLLNTFSKFLLSFPKTPLIKLVIKYSLMLPLLSLRVATDIITQTYSANIYLIKVQNKITRKSCETCSKLTIRPWNLFKANNKEQRQWRHSGVFIVNFK